jgi:hypothetical protein
MATDEPGEYSGGPHVIQTNADGHVTLPSKERRFINAVYRKRMAGIDVTIPADDLHRPGVDAVLADLDNSKGTGRTAGRTPDEAIGENIS